MKKAFLFIIALVLFGGFFVSCDIWSRGFAPKMTRDDIRQMQQFEPLAYVGSIENGNKFTRIERFLQAFLLYHRPYIHLAECDVCYIQPLSEAFYRF